MNLLLQFVSNVEIILNENFIAELVSDEIQLDGGQTVQFGTLIIVGQASPNEMAFMISSIPFLKLVII